MTYTISAADETKTIQAAMDAAAFSRKAYTVAAGGHRLTSTGLGYTSDSIINMVGDLYNDHGPLVGTLYCLTNRTSGRLRNVTIVGRGGSFVGSDSDPSGGNRKGLGIVRVDGFVVVGVRTDGPLNGFGMQIDQSTGGHISGLTLKSGINKAGADGLHFFGACSKVSGSKIDVSSGDDALSFTHEFQDCFNATMERITLSSLTLNSAAFSCIKFYTGPETGKSTIRNIRLTNIKGQILQGPTGCPLMMQNTGVANGAIIDNIVIENADLTFGTATTQDGPTAYLSDVSNVALRNVTLRGRRRGQFLRAIRCNGLTLTGELWDTIDGSSPTNMIQLEQCANYSIDVVVKSAAGVRLGTIKASSKGSDSDIKHLGINGA